MDPIEETNFRTPPMVSSEEVNLLMKSIRRIVRANDLGSRSLQKTAGLTAPQLAVLTAIGRMGETSTTRLAGQVDLSSATVVTILDNLERHGLVTRHRSQEDRRVVYARLTGQGADVMSRTQGPPGEAFLRRFAALPAERRRQMIENLETLADMMNAPAGNP